MIQILQETRLGRQIINFNNISMYGINSSEQIPSEYLESYSAWDNYMAHLWYGILYFCNIKNNSTIIELAPGMSTKIGIALSKIHFRGTFHIIDLSKKALMSLKKKYSVLLPNATIHLHHCSLLESFNVVPKKADFILSNHPLDDMLISKGASHEPERNVFDVSLEKKEYRDKIKEIWLHLESTPEKLLQYKKSIISELDSALRILMPKNMILTQYASAVLNRSDLKQLNNHAKKILSAFRKNHRLNLISEKTIQTILNANKNYNNIHIGTEVLNAKNWLVYQSNEDT